MNYYYRRKNKQSPIPKVSAVPNSWKKRDNQADCFYAYILKLSDNTYYSGSGRDVRERLVEHKNGMTISTAGKHPKLQYFETFKSRTEAEIREKELQTFIKNNPREIIRLIIRLRDDTRDLDYD